MTKPLLYKLVSDWTFFSESRLLVIARSEIDIPVDFKENTDPAPRASAATRMPSKRAHVDFNHPSRLPTLISPSKQEYHTHQLFRSPLSGHSRT